MLLVSAILLAGCGTGGRSGNTVADASEPSPSPSTVTSETILSNGAVAQPGGDAVGRKANPRQQEWLTRATAFLARPEQQRDLQAALRARAASHPHYCPAATFAPKRIDIAFDPEPQFTSDGEMTQGTAVYRATMQGCAEPVLLTVYVDAQPGVPLRFRAGLAGTTFADPDLQETAIPYAVRAARPLLPGCTHVAPVDTRRLGERPDASGSLIPWSESWLVAGCGKLVSTKLDFTPDRASNRMLVRVDPSATRLLRTGAATVGAGSATSSSGSAAPAAAGTARIVASATGTSLIPLGGAPIPGAKVAGTCLERLRIAAPATMPDHVECLQGLPTSPGSAIMCSASRGQAVGQMTATITKLDAAANTVSFACAVRAR